MVLPTYSGALSTEGRALAPHSPRCTPQSDTLFRRMDFPGTAELTC